MGWLGLCLAAALARCPGCAAVRGGEGWVAPRWVLLGQAEGTSLLAAPTRAPQRDRWGWCRAGAGSTDGQGSLPARAPLPAALCPGLLLPPQDSQNSGPTLRPWLGWDGSVRRAGLREGLRGEQGAGCPWP